MLAGLTAVETDARILFDCVKRIAPDRVQLNTSTRPTAEDFAYKVDQPQLEKIAAWSDPTAEVIADYRGVHGQGEFKTGEENVSEMIQRRPCSIEDIANGLGMHRNEVVKYIEELLTKQVIEAKSSGPKNFYCWKH